MSAPAARASALRFARSLAFLVVERTAVGSLVICRGSGVFYDVSVGQKRIDARRTKDTDQHTDSF